MTQTQKHETRSPQSHTKSAGVLALMGSGETGRSMIGAHRRILERLGRRPAKAVIIDSPYGFQENAPELTDKAVRYFRDALQISAKPTNWPRPIPPDTVQAAAVSRSVSTADWAFSGPGSPTYALRVWRRSSLASDLQTLLSSGGAAIFASAAALTLGALTVPVYEIYKAGEDPAWQEGLDVIGNIFGISVAVIPHFDNAEGGTHDTRFCYLGERRLRVLEEMAPEDSVVLGIDEHTCLILDLGRETAQVVGRGGVTVRRRGEQAVIPHGNTLAIEEMWELVGLRSAGEDLDGPPRQLQPPTKPDSPSARHTRQATAGEFEKRLRERDIVGAANVVLGALARGFSARTAEDSWQSAASMLATLAQRIQGELEETGRIVRPLIEMAVELRNRARADQRWEEADQIRKRLAELGIEVRDEPSGTTWQFRGDGCEPD